MTTDWVWVPFEIDKQFDGYRVDRYLAQRLAAYSRVQVQKILEASRVTRGDQPLKASAKVRGGERILIAYPRRHEAPIPGDAALPVLYEDNDLLVIDKPANLLSHPTDKIQLHTVLGYLRHLRPDLTRVHLLHRLDRETSGVLALAKNRAAARAWTKAMEERRIKKTYLAIVRGATPHKRGTLDAPIGRQGGAIKVRQWVDVPNAVSAVTRYEIVACCEEFSLVRAFPVTGRLHQIRVHFASMGHPILGDPLYQEDGAAYRAMIEKGLTSDDRARLGFPRLALHAASIRFPHPITGELLRILAPLPPDFRAFLAGWAKSDTLTFR
jgi:23S rRNA pseudouridine1911/1915/1917 synthase